MYANDDGAALPVSAEQRSVLTRMSRSSLLPHRKVVQARALLMAADGVANEQIARSCGADTVRRWRSRFARSGVDRVGVIAKGRGRKSSLPLGTVAEVLRLTRHEHRTQPSLAIKRGRAGTMNPATTSATAPLICSR